MFNKIKSFFDSDFFIRHKIIIGRFFYYFLVLVAFVLICTCITNESISEFLSLPLGLKCGILFLLYIFLSPPTTNDLEQDEVINHNYDYLLYRLERLESCVSYEEGGRYWGGLM